MLVAGMVSMLLLNITAAWQFYHRGKVITEVGGVGVARVLKCLREEHGESSLRRMLSMRVQVIEKRRESFVRWRTAVRAGQDRE